MKSSGAAAGMLKRNSGNRNIGSESGVKKSGSYRWQGREMQRLADKQQPDLAAAKTQTRRISAAAMTAGENGSAAATASASIARAKNAKGQQDDEIMNDVAASMTAWRRDAQNGGVSAGDNCAIRRNLISVLGLLWRKNILVTKTARRNHRGGENVSGKYQHQISSDRDDVARAATHRRENGEATRQHISAKLTASTCAERNQRAPGRRR